MLIKLLVFLLLAGLVQSLIINNEFQLKTAIDNLQPGSELIIKSENPIIINQTIYISVHNVTIKGLNLKAHKEMLGLELIAVIADNVKLKNFNLIGNRYTVDLDNVGSLLVIKGNNFQLIHGVVRDSSKNGINVGFSKLDSNPTNITGGIIRDIMGYNNYRDTVAIQGAGDRNAFIYNVQIFNVSAHRSSRGAIEISDGTVNISTTEIFAINSLYGVDIQDHHLPGQININVTVTNVVVDDCQYIIRTSNSPFNHHDGLILSHLKGNKIGVKVSNTRNVIIKHLVTFSHAVMLDNCQHVTIRKISNSMRKTAVVCNNSKNVSIEHVKSPKSKLFMKFFDTNNISASDLTTHGNIKLHNCNNYSFDYPNEKIIDAK